MTKSFSQEIDLDAPANPRPFNKRKFVDSREEYSLLKAIDLLSKHEDLEKCIPPIKKKLEKIMKEAPIVKGRGFKKRGYIVYYPSGVCTTKINSRYDQISTILSPWELSIPIKKPSNKILNKGRNLPAFYRFIYYKTFDIPVKTRTKPVDELFLIDLEYKITELMNNESISDELKFDLISRIKLLLMDNSEKRLLSKFNCNFYNHRHAYESTLNEIMKKRLQGFGTNKFCYFWSEGSDKFFLNLSGISNYELQCMISNKYSGKNVKLSASSIEGLMKQFVMYLINIGNPHVKDALNFVGLTETAKLFDELENKNEKPENVDRGVKIGNVGFGTG